MRHLLTTGRLRSQPWIDAFADVPRHLFLRQFFRQAADLSGWEAVSDRDPGALELIYRDATWVTQLDHDPDRWRAAHATGRPVPGTPTSSSTAPGLMALMLETLAVQDGQRVLEVGTGSGYNAALLCHRLGHRLVTTVDVDPDVAAAARAALRECGYAPTVTTEDAAGGSVGGGTPDDDQYERLIATCATPDIPRGWIDRIRPTGLILTSLHRDLGGGPLLLLRVDATGRAEGRFLAEYGSFMPVRASPVADAAARLTAALDTEPADTCPRAAEIGTDVLDDHDFSMIVALRLSGVAAIGFDPATGPQRWLIAEDGSWACLDETTGGLRQHGNRRIWDEIEQVHHQWVGWGRPARDRLGLTVTDTGEHRFWVDRPTAVWWRDPEPGAWKPAQVS